MLALLLALACTDGEHASETGTAGTTSACGSQPAVVTDIDETLTTADSEWLAQLSDATHDPAMRPDANAVFSAYADLGYDVYYLTARGKGASLSDGRTAEQATEDWLVDHGFPYSEGALFLADGVGALGDAAVPYKAGVIADLQAAGEEFALAYGNATTDIEAYQQQGIPDDQIWLVGVNAGQMGVNPLPDEDAYTTHLAEFVPTVAPADCE